MDEDKKLWVEEDLKEILDGKLKRVGENTSYPSYLMLCFWLRITKNSLKMLKRSLPNEKLLTVLL